MLQGAYTEAQGVVEVDLSAILDSLVRIQLCHVLGLCHSFKGCALPVSEGVQNRGLPSNPTIYTTSPGLWCGWWWLILLAPRSLLFHIIVQYPLFIAHHNTTNYSFLRLTQTTLYLKSATWILLSLPSFFFFLIFIYLFIFGCVGSSFLCEVFL